MKQKNLVNFKKLPVDLTKYYPILGEGRVLIKRDTIEEKTASGLYLPESVVDEKEETTTRGTVVAIGKLDPNAIKDMPCHPGLRITFGKYSGTEFEWDKEEFLIIRYDEIFASWPEDKEK